MLCVTDLSTHHREAVSHVMWLKDFDTRDLFTNFLGFSTRIHSSLIPASVVPKCFRQIMLVAIEAAAVVDYY